MSTTAEVTPAASEARRSAADSWSPEAAVPAARRGAAVERRLGPRDAIECPVLHCRLAAEVCVRRQIARWPGLNRTDEGSRAKEAGLFEHCGTGRCAPGREVRDALPAGYEPPPLPGIRRDIHAQWMALRRWQRERLSLVPDIDHPPGDAPQPARTEELADEPVARARTAGGRHG